MSSFSSSVMTMDLRSAPIITLSLASSNSTWVTMRLLRRAAIRAASLTRFIRSAPEKPGVPQQRRVEHVRPVGGGNQNDAFIGLEAIHLDEQLVQRLLAFVVAAAKASATVAADGVDLIDED